MGVELILKGRVQGVGCRYYCEKVARKLGLSGAATNLYDGTVSVILDTDNPGMIGRYIEALRNNSFNIHFFGTIHSISQKTYLGRIEGDYEW